MEKSPVFKSETKILELTSVDDLNEYTIYLDKLASHPHKYSLIQNDLRSDMFGNPYIIIQIKNATDLEEKQKKEFSFFARIISQCNLAEYDELTNDHWKEEIKLTYIQDYYVKDKENPMCYKIVIYYKVNESNILKYDFAKSLMPRSL